MSHISDEELLAKAYAATENSYVPYSVFRSVPHFCLTTARWSQAATWKMHPMG